MTQGEKQLLLKDLSARLLYGVICNTPKGDGHLCSINQTIFGTEYGINVHPIKRDYFGDSETEEQIVKPYLRPLSSMTEEEKEELKTELCVNIHEEDNGRHTEIYGDVCVYHKFNGESWYIPFEALDWLNAHHFDYRDLIENGLALEAPEGMYKTE